MQRCPHCQVLGLPWIEFALSTGAGPVRCVNCGGMACTNTVFSLYARVLSTPLFLIFAATALYLSSWWPLVAFGAFLLLYPIILLALPVTATTHVAAKRAGRFQLIALAVFLLCAVVAFMVTK